MAFVTFNQVTEFFKQYSPWIAVLMFVITIGFKLWPHLPTRSNRLRKRKDELERAKALKAEVEANTEWDDDLDYYGDFVVYDADRKLQLTHQTHSKKEALGHRVVLTDIQPDYLEFCPFIFYARYIKQVGDRWYEVKEEDEESVLVYATYHLSYNRILSVDWTTNDIWQMPKIACQYPTPNSHPYFALFFSKEEAGTGRKFLRKICDMSEVTKLPESLSEK